MFTQGRSLKYSLSGRKKVAQSAPGGSLSTSFALLELSVHQDAIGRPFMLQDGRLQVEGLHMGLHDFDSRCMNRPPAIGLRTGALTSWSCKVNHITLGAMAGAIWESPKIQIADDGLWAFYMPLLAFVGSAENWKDSTVAWVSVDHRLPGFVV